MDELTSRMRTLATVIAGRVELGVCSLALLLFSNCVDDDNWLFVDLISLVLDVSLVFVGDFFRVALSFGVMSLFGESQRLE